ncbi:MAG: FprA family A-type flavoprotein [Candidatus Hydrothermarchaeaceae archaeon]
MPNQVGILKAKEIKPDIYWVGAIDWNVRDFHGYVTPRGTTYNNFLIMDKKITLIDTVKNDFSDVMFERIRRLTNPEKIEVAICNHIELDHAGSWDKVMGLAKNAVLYVTLRGKQGLERHFDTTGWDIQTVKTGDTVKIGKRTLTFIETPMIHWPDSMMTYIPEDKLLISQDAFGQHMAQAVLYDEFVPNETLEDAVIDYYANILMPFGKLIKAKLEEIQSLKPGIDMIAPDHGIIWRKNPEKVTGMYMDMANGKAEEGVVIVYDTMWHSTERMSRIVLEGILDEGMYAEVIKLRETPMSVAIKQFWKYRGLLIGTPTLNNGMFPTVTDFLQHLKGLRPTNRITGAFGSYGWGGGGVREALQTLSSMKVEVIDPGYEVLYSPDKDDYESGYDFGRKFAREVRKFHENFE